MPEAQSVKSDSAFPVEQEKKRFTLWWIAVLVVMVLGISAYFLLQDDGASATQGTNDAKVKSVLHLETFVLNLADPDTKSYLRVGVDLGLRTVPAKDEPPPVALVRDTILTVLARARAEEVETPEGKERLKMALRGALRQRAPALEVEEIYFTEFLVQR